tara:strand:+ start:736 stop:876 length:141 start_codon:yes stop_codon:yes gene_type:complete
MRDFCIGVVTSALVIIMLAVMGINTSIQRYVDHAIAVAEEAEKGSK